MGIKRDLRRMQLRCETSFTHSERAQLHANLSAAVQFSRLGAAGTSVLRASPNLSHPKGVQGMLEHGKEYQRKFSGLSLIEQYAQLCALGDTKRYEERYRRGLEDFRELVWIEGVLEVGIDWQNGALMVGTDHFDAMDQLGKLHALGHYVLTLWQGPPPEYAVTNVTRTVGKESGTSYAHPHAQQGKRLCMSNTDPEVMCAIVDGVYSVGVRIITTALRMRAGEVELGSPYPSASIDRWPLEETRT